MNNEREKIRILLKCFNTIQHGANENLSGYDSEWLELKLIHFKDHINLSMEKVTDLYHLEQIDNEEKKEVRKIEEDLLKETYLENLKKAEKKYPISWEEIDKDREEAKKKTLETLTKPLSKEAKKKYVGTHTKAGKAPPKGKTIGFTEKKFKEIHHYRKLIKEVDAEAHPSQLGKVVEIMEYFEHVRKYRGSVRNTLKQLKLGSKKYYTWKKRLESGFKYNPKKSKKYISCVACEAIETPQWRKYEDGIYCNACGIKKYRKGLKKKNRGKK
jgi:hypothetical protein